MKQASRFDFDLGEFFESPHVRFRSSVAPLLLVVIVLEKVVSTSNVVFSEWDRIFKDPMTTAAAIDRLVHHSVILEMAGTSVRADTAEQAKKEGATTVTEPMTTRGKKPGNEVDGEV